MAKREEPKKLQNFSKQDKVLEKDVLIISLTACMYTYEW